MKFKKKEYKRVPRKLKKQIPVGMYCYVSTGKTSQIWDEEYKTFVTSYHTKECTFYDRIKIKDKPEIEDWEKEYLEEWTGWCKLYKLQPDDQCKSCGLKYGRY